MNKEINIGKGSIWENPFKIGIDGTKEEVMSKYEAYIMNRSDLIDRLSELEGNFFKPDLENCHGYILKIMVEDRIWEK